MPLGAAREHSFVWRCFIIVGGGLTQLTRGLAARRTRDAVMIPACDAPRQSGCVRGLNRTRRLPEATRRIS